MFKDAAELLAYIKKENVEYVDVRTNLPTLSSTQLDLLSRLFGVNSRAVAEKNGDSWKVDVGPLSIPLM